MTTKTASSLRDFLISITLEQRECVDNDAFDKSSTDATNSNVHQQRVHLPVYNKLYLTVCDTLIGQLKFRFDKDSLILEKSVDAGLRCDKHGIKVLVDKYCCVLNINQQIFSAEMKLFSSTASEISMNIIQKTLDKDKYPVQRRLIEFFQNATNTELVAITHGSGAIHISGSVEYSI